MPDKVVAISDNENKETKRRNTNAFNRSLKRINDMLGRASVEVYGTDRTSDIDALNNKFQDILKTEIGTLNNNEKGDITSFIGKLYSNDKKNAAYDDIIASQFSAETGSDFNSIQAFFYEKYRNRIVEHADLHEVATQLTELTRAIEIMRDAIISPDIIEGRMSREIRFDGSVNEENAIDIVEEVEKRLGLLEKIKNFIVPKTLEYGSYYAYTIPYSKIFIDFAKKKNKSYSDRFYREATILTESFDNNKNEYNTFIKEMYKDFTKENTNFIKHEKESSILEREFPSEKDFESDMKVILSNISVSNDAIPLPVLFEGEGSMAYYSESVYNEKENPDNGNYFDIMSRQAGSEALISDKEITDIENSFKEIKDVYIKMIEPTKCIPIEILDTVIGYYYIQDEDINPLTGIVTNNLYFTRFNDNPSSNVSIIDNIAERVVKSFDKKFLLDNVKFKKEIANAIQYFDLSKKKIKFQFIPVEYMQEFKVDVDEDNHGQSMLKKALFYAKLYLMLLLFKIMSIVLYSNDTKVNYIRNSGIDKDIYNKTQEIIRNKQNRQITLMDLFTYTTLINKVGNGNEMYVPLGRSGERPVETEILAGQEVQLNTDLMEMLKNAYISSTPVPPGILNAQNEADFAKTIEESNTKMNAAVVSYQLDFNPEITEWYKKILKYTTTLSDNDIDSFTFSFKPPKTVASNARAEAIQQFETLANFIVGILFEDPSQTTDETLANKIRIFKKNLAKDQLSTINMDRIYEIYKDSMLEDKKEQLRPDPEVGDDDELEEELNNMEEPAGMPSEEEEEYPG